MQRINNIKSYARTTAAFEGYNNARTRFNISSALTVGTSMRKPFDQSQQTVQSSRMAKMVYGADESWIEKSPKSMQISGSVLASKRPLSQTMIDFSS